MRVAQVPADAGASAALGGQRGFQPARAQQWCRQRLLRRRRIGGGIAAWPMAAVRAAVWARRNTQQHGIRERLWRQIIERAHAGAPRIDATGAAPAASAHPAGLASAPPAASAVASLSEMSHSTATRVCTVPQRRTTHNPAVGGRSRLAGGSERRPKLLAGALWTAQAPLAPSAPLPPPPPSPQSLLAPLLMTACHHALVMARTAAYDCVPPCAGDGGGGF